MAVKELLMIVPPPEKAIETGNAKGWAQIEIDLGLQLPADYKDFIANYGSGNLVDFIHVFSPFSESEHLSLPKMVGKICEIYRDLKVREGNSQVPFAVYPDKRGLLPWGRTDNGHFLFWLTEGKDWPVVLAEGRSSRFQRFEMTATSFLARALQQRIDSKIWPDDFPDPDSQILFYPAKKKQK